MEPIHPIRLEATLHETIWGGRRLEQDGWKQLPINNIAIGEAWETEINTFAQNEPYKGKTLGSLVAELGTSLLGKQAIAIHGQRFPLLAKFIDAHAKLSVQVHPNDEYASTHENGKFGKTEFWYILAAEPNATIVHGFKTPTTSALVKQAIEQNTLEDLLHEEVVFPDDVIFVPAGTVHAIGSGVMLFELQQYSDITYRMYDYGRLTANGTPRTLHIAHALAVTAYTQSPRVKAQPVSLPASANYTDRCLVACHYFLTREITFQPQDNSPSGYMKGQTTNSCILLTSLSADIHVHYGDNLSSTEPLFRGQTMILPASLGEYCLDGNGTLLFSYVPDAGDSAWSLWEAANTPRQTYQTV